MIVPRHVARTLTLVPPPFFSFEASPPFAGAAAAFLGGMIKKNQCTKREEEGGKEGSREMSACLFLVWLLCVSKRGARPGPPVTN
jgi:hypothetical protein